MLACTLPAATFPYQVIAAPSGIPDVAPTVLALAGVSEHGYKFDGQSMVALFMGTAANRLAATRSWRTNYFIEYYGVRGVVQVCCICDCGMAHPHVFLHCCVVRR